jgi:hypothetical protein
VCGPATEMEFPDDAAALDATFDAVTPTMGVEAWDGQRLVAGFPALLPKPHAPSEATGQSPEAD